MRPYNPLAAVVLLVISGAVFTFWPSSAEDEDEHAESVVDKGKQPHRSSAKSVQSEKVSPLARAARLASKATPSPRFSDMTVHAGVGTDPVEGIAFVDIDDDGWPDITAVGRGGFRVFQNRGDGTFVDIGSLFPDDIRGTGVVWADVDSDGDLDLVVTSEEGRTRLFLAQPPTGFRESEFPRTAAVRGAGFADLDGDDDLDLYLCAGRQPKTTEEWGYGGHANYLMRNDGGRFTDVALKSGAALGDTNESFQPVMLDFDSDGDTDLMVIHDVVMDTFLRNDGNNEFKDVTESWLGRWNIQRIGAAFGDVDGDGHLDIYSAGFPRSVLMVRKQPSGFYLTHPLVIAEKGESDRRRTGFGCALADIDNDGDQDALVAAGYDADATRATGFPFVGRLAVLQNDGMGAFSDQSESSGLRFNQRLDGSGLAIADYDRDGDMDVVIALDEQPDQSEVGEAPDRWGVLLLRNDGIEGVQNGFLSLRLMQSGKNTRAVGAVVQVVTGDRQTSRVLTAGDSYRSAHSYALHFGLGQFSGATVNVRWPDGKLESHTGISGHILLVRGQNPKLHRPGGGHSFQTPPCNGDCSQCAPVCDRLSSCGLLSPMGVSTVRQCLGVCASRPFDQGVGKCVNAASCDAIHSCFSKK